MLTLKQLAGRPQDLQDEVKEAELDDALRAMPAQRLAWLEEALKLAWQAGATRGDEWS